MNAFGGIGLNQKFLNEFLEHRVKGKQLCYKKTREFLDPQDAKMQEATPVFLRELKFIFWFLFAGLTISLVVVIIEIRYCSIFYIT